jgi:hypothetical protein
MLKVAFSDTFPVPLNDTRTPSRSKELIEAVGKVIRVVGVTVNEAVGVPRPTTIMPAPLFTAEIPALASTSVLKAPVPSVTSIPATGEGWEVVLVIETPELIACPGMGKPDILVTIANAGFREKASSALR